MHDTLSGRAAELAHLTDLIRTSLVAGRLGDPIPSTSNWPDSLNWESTTSNSKARESIPGRRARLRRSMTSRSSSLQHSRCPAALAARCGVPTTTQCRYGDSHHEPPRPSGAIRRVRQATADRAGDDPGRRPEADRRTTPELQCAGSVIPGPADYWPSRIVAAWPYPSGRHGAVPDVVLSPVAMLVAGVSLDPRTGKECADVSS